MASKEAFDISLAYGGIREQAFANILFKATVECKSDRICRRTGNVFIEYKQRGRPSGIAVTEAEFWAIEFDSDCWIVIPVDRLKAVCRWFYKQHPELRRSGGDNENEGVLIPLSELIAKVGCL